MGMSLARRCLACAGRRLAPDGACLDCAPADLALPSRGGTYGRRDVMEMVRRMEADDALADTVDEIAVLTLAARRLLDMGDLPAADRTMGDGERTSALRMTVQGIASAKNERTRLMLERKMLLTMDDFRAFLGELHEVIRRTVDDEGIRRALGDGVSSIRLGRPSPW